METGATRTGIQKLAIKTGRPEMPDIGLAVSRFPGRKNPQLWLTVGGSYYRMADFRNHEASVVLCRFLDLIATSDDGSSLVKTIDPSRISTALYEVKRFIELRTNKARK